MTCAYHGSTASLREIVGFIRRLPSAREAAQSIFATADIEGKTALEIARSRKKWGCYQLLAELFIEMECAPADKLPPAPPGAENPSVTGVLIQISGAKDEKLILWEPTAPFEEFKAALESITPDT